MLETGSDMSCPDCGHGEPPLWRAIDSEAFGWCGNCGFVFTLRLTTPDVVTPPEPQSAKVPPPGPPASCARAMKATPLVSSSFLIISNAGHHSNPARYGS